MTEPRDRRRRLACFALLLAAGLVTALASRSPSGREGGPLPAGFDLVARDVVDSGVEHLVLRRSEPRQEVHVARLAPAARARLRAVLAGSALSGPGATAAPTSTLCARARCAVAVNGDFADPAGHPVGAMVSAGELVTTPGPAPALAQLRLDAEGRPSIGDLWWSVELRTGRDRRLSVDAVNRPALADGVTLYTSRWGETTGTDGVTLELVIALTGGSGHPLPAGVTDARLLGVRAGGGSPVVPGTVVLAGRGRGAARLLGLWRGGVTAPGAPAVLRVSTGGAVESVGGSPRLLPSGSFTRPTPEAAPFVMERHPRTMVGITATGEVLLVALDGRQPGRSEGVSLAEAASILAGLGAAEGVNLDGGGSTTFVVGGRVSNRPSDGAGERPVPSALVVVPGRGAPR